MKILKKENWWIWLLLFIFGNGTNNILLGALLDVYNKDAWYTKWQYWLLGFSCFFLPFFIMLTIFYIQINCQVCAKLKVPGKEVYLSPYIWLLLLIIPVIGWIFLVIMIIYTSIWPIVMLYRGQGERYIK